MQTAEAAVQAKAGREFTMVSEQYLLLVTCRVTGEAAERADAPVRFIIEAEPAVPALPAPAKAL